MNNTTIRPKSVIWFPLSMLIFILFRLIIGIIEWDESTIIVLLIPLSIYSACLLFIIKNKISAIIVCSAFMFYTGLMATTTTGIKIAMHEFYTIDILLPPYIITSYVGRYKLMKHWNAVKPQQERKL